MGATPQPSAFAELAAAGELAVDGAATLASGIQQVHHAVAGRAFGPHGPTAAPARAVHDAIAGAVYASVRAGVGAGVGLAAAAAALARRDRPAPSTTPRGAALVGALNGALGDRLAAGRSALATEMAVRVDGVAIAPEPGPLAEAFPDATGHVAVFLHGLGETERSWAHRAVRWHGDPSSTHATRLRRDLPHVTPVLLRANTGLRISDNARLLADLLDDLVASWPVPVHALDLVGHSMGGLIARAAAHDLHRPWTVLLRHVVCLGTPHLGAPLEQLANMAAHGLARVPELRPLAQAINLRSAGIKDLRRGSTGPDDWLEADVDGWRTGRCTDLQLPPQARCHVLSATLHRDPDHPLSRALGDLLVLHRSASGDGLPFARRAHAGGLDHFALLNHPVAYAWLRATLGDPPQLPPGS